MIIIALSIFIILCIYGNCYSIYWSIKKIIINEFELQYLFFIILLCGWSVLQIDWYTKYLYYIGVIK